MSTEAFDRLLSRIDDEERERIHEMAIAYGLSFDDPSWVPFAITQMTLDELKMQTADAAKEIGQAADRALRKIGNSAQSVSAQVQRMAEAQSAALKSHQDTLDALERESTARYQKLLAELSAQTISRLIEKGANGIAQDVSRQLTGEHGMLVQSATDHTAALEEARGRFVASIDAAVSNVDKAARKAAGSMRRGVQGTALLAMGVLLLHALAVPAFVIFWTRHQLFTEPAVPATCSVPQPPAGPREGSPATRPVSPMPHHASPRRTGPETATQR
ncbi:hypothetical protein [Paraburkholderia nodosa]|uniref:hypothetical protein n=1 Tax=Paraburkholderia nodosa TaxID=392320 RepID=UPI0008413FDD|nr:hypothetical protein [Paraburkholderia nodosa]